jgi:cytochrome c oxidase assembly factor CtaG
LVLGEVYAVLPMRPNLSWTLSPPLILVLAAAGGAYFRRWRAVRRAPGARAGTDAPVWRLCCFAGSLACTLIALASPLDSLSEQLFSIHMVQHIVLLDVAPILAILGFTRVLLRPLTRAIHRLERSAGPLASPAFAVALYIAVIWAWHIPGAYDLALRNGAVHVLEHASFLAAGSLYWWHLLSPIRARMRLPGMGPIVYMATAKLFVGALGMGLAFAPRALYPYYAHHARVWGLSAPDDQAIAGLAMALEQSIVMGIALVVLLIAAIGESEREQQRRERYETA